MSVKKSNGLNIRKRAKNSNHTLYRISKCLIIKLSKKNITRDNMNYYIDTHAHLYLDDYSKDIEQVMMRAKEANVIKVILPAIDLHTSDKAIELAEKYENIFVCVGIHPHESAKAKNYDITRITDLIKHPKVVGIGEIGLDYYYDFSPRNKQKEIFSLQLEIAIKADLPIVVHTRESIKDTVEIIETHINKNPEWKISKDGFNRGVFHCFPGSIDEANIIYQLGFFASYTGLVTFKKTASIEIIKKIGIDRILLETDSPYMAPVPFRGKRNEPANIIYIGKKISEILNIAENDVKRITTKNAIRLFELNKLG